MTTYTQNNCIVVAAYSYFLWNTYSRWCYRVENENSSQSLISICNNVCVLWIFKIFMWYVWFGSECLSYHHVFLCYVIITFPFDYLPLTSTPLFRSFASRWRCVVLALRLHLVICHFEKSNKKKIIKLYDDFVSKSSNEISTHSPHTHMIVRNDRKIIIRSNIIWNVGKTREQWCISVPQNWIYM